MGEDKGGFKDGVNKEGSPERKKKEGGKDC